MSGDRVFVGLETAFAVDLPATMDRVRVCCRCRRVAGLGAHWGVIDDGLTAGVRGQDERRHRAALPPAVRSA
jgi:hypothetical protein